MATIPKTISVTEQNEEWINFRIKSGDFGNVSEYIRDLIRRDKEHQNKIEDIRKALIEGEKSGLSNRSPKDIMQAVRDGKL